MPCRLDHRAPSTALPWGYWVIFGLYEPVLAVSGFIGALADPKKVSIRTFMHRAVARPESPDCNHSIPSTVSSS